MTIHRIEVRDPMVVRDGRINDGRSQSRGLGFPPPSVLAGVARTGLGRRDDRFDSTLAGPLLQGVRVRGPLLAADEAKDGTTSLFVPAPADALITGGPSDPSGYCVQPLRPIPTPAACESSHQGILVGLPASEMRKTKPARSLPRFWSWAAFSRWLEEPTTLEGAEAEALLQQGLSPLIEEERVHVAIGDTGTAVEGKLFETSGFRGRALPWRAGAAVGEPRRVDTGVAVHLQLDVEVEAGLELPGELSGMRPMAGERRLTCWSASSAGWPPPPSGLLDHVRANERALVRLILLTPAYVEHSLTPRCLGEAGELLAARVDRPQTISGWDFARRGPKKTRRLAPAGSVYWLRLAGDADARVAWVHERWLQNIGDDPQLRRDGFGLAAVGIGTEVTA